LSERSELHDEAEHRERDEVVHHRDGNDRAPDSTVKEVQIQ